MPISETWLLPDGVADVLPEQAQVIESLRRKSLDFLASRGYQLVYTPFIEYIESLSSLSESNQDLDLATFKVIDQLSGRLLGVRADMTPQVARIDAHVHPVEGVARYCYAGTVLQWNFSFYTLDAGNLSQMMNLKFTVGIQISHHNS